MFRDAGAAMSADIAAALGEADMVLRVRGPSMEEDGWELRRMRRDAVLVGFLAPWHDHARIAAYAEHGLSAFTMEFMPRITRAQRMDALSSQARSEDIRGGKMCVRPVKPRWLPTHQKNKNTTEPHATHQPSPH